MLVLVQTLPSEKISMELNLTFWSKAAIIIIVLLIIITITIIIIIIIIIIKKELKTAIHTLLCGSVTNSKLTQVIFSKNIGVIAYEKWCSGQ